jgi:predicted phosphoribosyltransferase
MGRLFGDRREAGKALAQAVRQYAGRNDVIVLALPRGGVPVGYEVARALRAPLDVFLVRKLGVPGHEELAMGALASGGLVLINEDVVNALGIRDHEIDSVAAREAHELIRREEMYRRGRPALDVLGKFVILVDDGLATGSSMRAAVAALRALGPARIVVAAPVASHEACELVAEEADDVVCLYRPEAFFAVGAWYDRFDQTTDDEVRALMRETEPVHAAPN